MIPFHLYSCTKKINVYNYLMFNITHAINLLNLHNKGI